MPATIEQSIFYNWERFFIIQDLAQLLEVRNLCQETCKNVLIANEIFAKTCIASSRLSKLLSYVNDWRSL